WAGGDPSASYLRGALHPDMARDLYTLPSEVLIAKSAKSVLWVSVISHVSFRISFFYHYLLFSS
ncbi:unnamed protein product, partial [Musa textilis]